MKTTTDKALEIRDALDKAMTAIDASTKLELEGAVIIDLVENFRIVRDATKDFDKARDLLVKKHGKPTKAGGFEIAGGTKEFAAFAEEVNKLALRELDLPFKVTPKAATMALAKTIPMKALVVLLDVGLIAAS